MAKLYFKFGVMGSSKSAQALMCKHNYEQQGFNVLLAKPQIDTRDGSFVKSRIGIQAPCTLFSSYEDLMQKFQQKVVAGEIDVVIIDECQFCTKEQIEQLKELSGLIPVICYGLKTNFKSYLFEGSKRLMEIADSISEIKSVCKCGQKSSINARLSNGRVVISGNEIEVGGDDKYMAMCYNCWKDNQDNGQQEQK